MEPTTETNTPVEVVPVAVEAVSEPSEPVVETPVEAAPEPVVETPLEAAPEPVVEPVVDTPVEAAPEVVPETTCDPASETPVEVASDPKQVLDLSDYTTPEYLDMVKKLIEKPISDPEPENEISKKTFKPPGYTSIQMTNTSKQPRRKSMSFV